MSVKKVEKATSETAENDAKKTRVAKLKMRSKKEKERSDKGVVLLSHIPRGFFEPQMFDFFSQFGDVTRLKLFRSMKTGRSRHFAFIEFRFKEVAEIVAQTMNNYLLFQKILKCRMIPKSEVRKSTFRHWRLKYKPPKHRKRSIQTYNRIVFDPDQIKRREEKTIERRKALQSKLNDLGIEYDVFNVKRNEQFIPAERTRASEEDIRILRTKVKDVGGRCSDFEYSEDEEEEDGKEDNQDSSQLITENDSEQVPVDAVADEANDTELVPEAKDLIDNEKSLGEDTSDFSVMVLDPDDEEITFKTPPAEAKIKRRPIKNSLLGDRNSSFEGNDAVPLSSSSKKKRRRTLQQLQKSLDSDEEVDFSVTNSKAVDTALPKKKKGTPVVDKKALRKRKPIAKSL